MIKNNNQGFSIIKILLPIILCALIITGWNKYHRTTDEKFIGIVNSDNCGSNVGDTGCFIQIGNKVIQVMHGNSSNDQWGSFTELPSGDLTGHTVEVYAHRNNDTHFDLSGTQYYVKLVK